MKSYAVQSLVALVAVVVAVGLNLALGYTYVSAGISRLVVWIVTLGCILVLLGAIGTSINGRWHGVIIDARNKVSLSKLQATAWTVLVGSALPTYAAARGASNLLALSFEIPPELLIAMGISATSLVAAPAVLSLKAGDGSTLPWNDDGAAKIDVADGRVAGRTTARNASWLDIFRGDEVGNADAPDLSKVQQFLISIVLIVVYGTEIANALLASDSPVVAAVKEQLDHLPRFDTHMLWLLGISHAAYISYKAVPHSGSTPAGSETSVG